MTGRWMAVAAVLLSCAACTSMRLAWLEPFPANQPLTGPQGSYELTPQSEHWVRITRNERIDTIDLALARNSADAWLNVSVLARRFPTPASALAHAQAQADALMVMVSRQELDLTVPSPDGNLPARLGVYCGSFDRELRSRSSCFVILTTVRKDLTYVLVGQVRLKDPEPGRRDELESLVRSLRLIDAAEGSTGTEGRRERSRER